MAEVQAPQLSRIGSDDRVSSEPEIQDSLRPAIPAECRIQRLKDRRMAVFEFLRILKVTI